MCIHPVTCNLLPLRSSLNSAPFYQKCEAQQIIERIDISYCVSNRRHFINFNSVRFITHQHTIFTIREGTIREGLSGRHISFGCSMGKSCIDVHFVAWASLLVLALKCLRYLKQKFQIPANYSMFRQALPLSRSKWHL